jgi:hypothetical protein
VKVNGGGQVYSAILLIIKDCPLEIAREINELAAWFIEVVQGAWAMFLQHWLVFATAPSGLRINYYYYSKCLLCFPANMYSII